MGRLISWASGAVVVLVVIIAAGAGMVGSLFGGGGGAAGCGATITTPGTTPRGLTAEQSSNASVIVTAGQRVGVPPRGWVIAIATALQESNLINLGHLGDNNDHDSLGLFQQRPSQGWGTPEQLTNPTYAATKFYERLQQVPRWETLPLTNAAQAVQRSAYPDAYAKHEARATAIVTAFAGGMLPECLPQPIGATGWTKPVPAPVGSEFRSGDRPEHDGVDLSTARGTVIRAASGGVVVTVLCNVNGRSYPPTGAALPCDTDGYPGLGGCGWYVEIRHAGDIVSRYCHMVRQPSVRVGQPVAPGAPIGLVGTSGNSSGPHLHFEIHDAYPASSRNAINPIPFMIQRGAPL